MPNNWKTYKVSDFVDINPKVPLIKNNDYSFVEMKDLNSNNKFASPSNFKELKGGARFVNRDTLFARITPCLENGKICQVKDLENDIGFGSTEFLVFRGKKDTSDSDFIYYLSRTPLFRRFAESKMIGTSGRQRVAKDAFANLELELPSLPEQRAIASILSALDDKIELNLQMNKTLEEMAMALYKHWFVDFEFPNSPPGRGAEGGVGNYTQQAEGQSGNYTQQPEGQSSKQHPKDSTQSEGVNYTKVPRNTKNFMSLPYNPKLKERARELRKAGNLAEVLFWQQVHKGKFNGLDFDRQKIIGNYIVDFYCANVNVVVEIDGSSHDNKQAYDAKRDAYLQGLGLTVIHITDTQVKDNLANTIADLKTHPAFQAPLPGRGSTGYKSSGGKFVDSELGLIPEGWEVKRILEIVNLLSGGTPKTTNSEYWGGHICWVSAKDIGNGGLYINDTEKKITELGVAKSSTKVLPADTVILVARGSVGKYGMIAKEMAMNQSCYGLYSNSDYSQGLVYLMFSKLVEQFQRMAYGSVFDTITTSTFKSTNVVVPPPSVIQKVKSQIDPLFDQLKQNILENETLTQTRDTLLPKLISGEVRVKEAQQIIANAL